MASVLPVELVVRQRLRSPPLPPLSVVVSVRPVIGGVEGEEGSSVLLVKG